MNRTKLDIKLRLRSAKTDGTTALLSVMILTGCMESSTSFNPLEAGSGVTPTASCTASVVDHGQKGTAAASARGNYSDLRISPTTGGLNAAYYDASTLSLKYAYWTGTHFTTEIVAGEGVAAFVRMVVTPDGRPILFWTQGTNLKAALRTSAPPEEGTWTAGVIDTGTAPRSVDAAVNPLGQVGVSFLTDTATAGRPKFLYCDTPCTTPQGFQIMSPNPWVENTAIIAAQTNTDFAWCKVSDSQYYPAMAYSVTGITRYAVCRNTLANCLSNTNWQTQTVVATGSVSKSFFLDPTVTGDVPKFAVLGATGITPYRMGATACTAAPAAFSAGTVMGSATSGNQWLKLLGDGLGKFHIFANEGTASVRYYNSQTTTITGTWNAAAILETVTLPAALQGGATVDNSSGGIFFSYPTAAGLYDFRTGRVEDYTVASNSVSFRSNRFDMDLTGALQLVAANAQLHNVSSASTAAGRPSVAYVDYSPGAATTGRLKYASRTSNSSDSLWDYAIVGDTISPQFPSLALDSNNRPWIGYFEANQLLPRARIVERSLVRDLESLRIPGVALRRACRAPGSESSRRHPAQLRRHRLSGHDHPRQQCDQPRAEGGEVQSEHPDLGRRRYDRRAGSLGRLASHG
jgi:hypothetical protein